MTDKVKEVYNSLQERLKSPFILTFIIVWCIKHWRLILIVLNFKETENAISKQTQIEDYIKGHLITIKGYDLPNWTGMVLPVLFWSLVSIATYYLITIITETIGIWYKRLKSKAMQYLNESRAVVTIEEYNTEITKVNRLQVRNETLTKRLGEIETQYSNEKRAVDAIMEKINSELAFYKNENKTLTDKNVRIENDLITMKLEQENLINNYKTFDDEIKLTEHKLKVSEQRITKRNSKIRQLIDKINTSNNLDELKNSIINESIVNIDSDDSNTEQENVTITGNEASQILKEVFGFDAWLFEANYPNNKKITEKIRLMNNYFLLESGQRILIDNVYLDKDKNTIRFTKSNLSSTTPYEGLLTKLDIKGKNKLEGIEGSFGFVTYKRL